jgi:hypothetical protein
VGTGLEVEPDDAVGLAGSVGEGAVVGVALFDVVALSPDALALGDADELADGSPTTTVTVASGAAVAGSMPAVSVRAFLLPAAMAEIRCSPGLAVAGTVTVVRNVERFDTRTDGIPSIDRSHSSWIHSRGLKFLPVTVSVPPGTD